jgi:hypothetical protein
MVSTGVIRLYRSRANLFDIGMAFTVFIDGVDVGKIWSNQIKAFEVAPGAHKVYVRFVLLRKSAELEITLDAGSQEFLFCRTSCLIYPILKRSSENDILKMRADTLPSPIPRGRDLGNSVGLETSFDEE